MAVENKNISYRIYLVAFAIFVMAIFVAVKLTNIQWVEGEYYRKLAKERTVKNFVIPANKGNVYSADGSLLATSIPNYTIRFDAVAPKAENFDKNIKGLADSLSVMLGKPSGYYQRELKTARNHKNRYYLIARKLSYTQYMRMKTFPLFNLGANKGGMITEQKTVREHPIGKIAERTIGYERFDENGKGTRVGIEGAFGEYINGKDGKRLMQKIAKNQWKPISDNNEIEPRDGYDIISTIDVYIQDIAHHALLKQLEYYQADHGCVVVMETKTGEVKAISNLGRAESGSYYETINYAVAESHEPGSTFKLVDLIALLDDEKVDTSKVYDSKGGDITYRNRHVRDSHKGGYGKISLARGFEVSSNTILVQAIYENYKDNPEQFVNRLNTMGLNKPLGLPFKGEGIPRIPQPSEKSWSAISLPWMAFGYGVSMTPLQTLTLYNAVANNGEMVKPKFVREIKEWNKTIKKFDKEVINPKICSDEALAKIKAILGNVVKKGTGSKLYSKDFSMAGKTGTAQVDYHKGDGKMYYASSFVGFFPADEPKYSCVVVVHKPNVAAGYYGADVAGPVFKRIAQKIFTDVPSTNEIKTLNVKIKHQEKNYAEYYNKVQKKESVVPNVKGMSGMDAIALLENFGMKVKVVGVGKVKQQSIQPGQRFNRNQIITIELS
ncbi:peptidoglycan glycosyltransferase FtsI precursor [Flavobacterium cauense R2A-7]|uniref:Cell division protein FtsI (Penicillin-binding protein 3) n=1 Tax=Flavobacterium cauense R2A-7 TaxID=1341154 RepID=V6S1Q0_9FLAO|nr:penicillin-binding transpeptidase domain-containing protein [Flavobacterium cauense]ESU20162.1 peptidoglycan glycosyltransferase FtsI precursor [Flavobacterium cauense R2A-7]KGO83963.1 penicillin-binding protein [Flavobacterium cauense R2A-7]TWI14695.1 cell division protein FtsI (penicillin-binding protein 3) [Flavobacterium cauense R2A-7]